MPIHDHFFRRAILTHQVSQTDLVFAVRLGCISKIITVCVVTGVTTCATIVAGKFNFYILTPVNRGRICQLVQMHLR